MYVIGITEVQFLAYLQLIRYRLHLINNLLIDFINVTSSQKNRIDKRAKAVNDISQTKSQLFEPFLSQGKDNASNAIVKNYG